MKKFYYLLLMMVVPITMNAYDFKVDGLCYNWLNGSGTEVEVTRDDGNNKYSGDVVIPETVTYNEKTYAVTRIGNLAFYGCDELLSVYIGKSVVSLGDYAVQGCRKLTSIIVDSENPVYDSRGNCNAIIETATRTLVTGCKGTLIPPSVTSIGTGAFGGVRDMGYIDIPSSVSSIGIGAFESCSELEWINMSNSVTYIGSAAFIYTLWDYNNVMDPDLPERMVYVGSVAYHYNREVSEGTNITLDEGTVGIAGEAFALCGDGLSSVTIPSTVVCIGENTFANCHGIKRIVVKAITPPVFPESSCYLLEWSSLYDQVTLYVPNESMAFYRADREWGRFSHIVPFVGAGPGDVDGDGVINVSDVTNLVDLLLSGEELPAYIDVNGDGNVNVSDVSVLIDQLLSEN